MIFPAAVVLLMVICLVYGFASDVFAAPWDLRVLYAAYVADNVLFALRVARTTYLKKIANDPRHVSPTLTMGTTIDHVFSIGIALASGVIWSVFGYQYVFVIGALIAEHDGQGLGQKRHLAEALGQGIEAVIQLLKDGHVRQEVGLGAGLFGLAEPLHRRHGLALFVALPVHVAVRLHLDLEVGR